MLKITILLRILTQSSLVLPRYWREFIYFLPTKNQFGKIFLYLMRYPLFMMFSPVWGVFLKSKFLRFKLEKYLEVMVKCFCRICKRHTFYS